jgi:DNA polymerase elongation subunit (family B)
MINVEQYENFLNVSYVDENGIIKVTKIDIPENEKFNWIESDKKTDTLSFKDTFLKKKKDKFLNKHRIIEFLNQQTDDLKNKLFSYNIPRIYFIDIETESNDRVPDSKNPKEEIYSISIVNEFNQIVTFATKILNKQQIFSLKERINKYFNVENQYSFKFLSFQDEYQMLTAFLLDYCPKMSCLTGWNFLEFDWSYIVARAQLYKIDINLCSITKKTKNRKLKNKTVIVPIHKTIIDYQELYEKLDESLIVKESNSLNYVAENITGYKKVEYKGSLQDLYENNFEDFIFYNIIDSILVKLIHENTKLINTLFVINSISQTEYDKAISPINVIESILEKYYLNKNKKVIDVIQNNNKVSFTGGYSFPVELGFKKWVLNFDYTSMHPTTIMQFNISPETYLGKVNISDQKTDDFIYASNGVFFKKEKGVLPEMIEDLFKQRMKYKKEIKDIDKKIQQVKKILKIK